MRAGALTRRAIGRTIAVLLGTSVCAAIQAGETPQARLQMAACEQPGLPAEARCGRYAVREDRNLAAGRRINLNVVLIPSQAQSPEPDPLVFLAGGPGQAASEMAQTATEMFASVRAHRDVLLVDQRGTGRSNPLRCTLYGSDLASYFGALFPPEAVARCRRDLEARADLAQYATPMAADDLDEVRAALGYQRLNIYGTSYGTMAAQWYLARYPRQVRTMILKAVAPVDQALSRGLLTYARDSQEALDALFEECRADDACRNAFPDIRGDFKRLLAGFSSGSARVSLKNPMTGESESVALSRGALTGSLVTAMQSASSTRQLPMLIHQAAGGDMTALASAILAVRRSLDQQISVGMHLSVMCSEGNPEVDDTTIAQETAGTFLGADRFRDLRRACSEWPRTRLEPMPRQTSEAPVLLLSGSLDPNTPPRGGETLSRQLPNSRHVVLQNISHSMSGAQGCADVLMSEFIAKGTLQGLDASCATRISPQPFAVPKSR